MSDDEEDRYAEPAKPAWQRIGMPAAAAIVAAGLVALAVNLLRHPSPSARPHVEPHIMNVKLPPPPPPPPPPKTPPPPTKTVEHTKSTPTPAKMAQPKAAPKAPSPPAAVSTSIKGDGPGSMANGNGGGGDCIGEGCGNGDGSGGDSGAFYSNVVDSEVRDILQRDDKLRSAHYHAVAAIIIDRSGHAVSVTLRDFDGDPEVKTEIEHALQRFAASEGFPENMTNNGIPWVVRISAHARG
jgi:hypothetical protein